jgi:sodium transport system permease protein
VTTEPAPAESRDRLHRLWRLTLKELREILRDRRTIITLVLMPLLLYPLLTIAFQQFFMTQLGTVQRPRYTIGFRNGREASYLIDLLSHGGIHVVDLNEASEPARSNGDSRPIFEAGVRPELERGLAEFDIHVGMRVLGDNLFPDLDPRANAAIDIELLYRDDSLESRGAVEEIETCLRATGEKFLSMRLDVLGVTQRVAPVQAVKRSVESGEAVSGTISIAAVIPFILILMTVTGAVYPAIDLTAGERERGTLEILVAAPIPRVGLLFAKYVAVLAVALLTAAANLLTMTLTISVSGLGRLLFGEAGISPGVIAAVFGLLLLFAAFFSAVLLVITSSARSFKEAQAYLIPLMLLALAPGMLSLMPGLELKGLLLVTPLANIVLLGRDLFALKASGGAALAVVGSTLLYAGAAIGVAARIFGAESVLYSNQPGWADLFRRPRNSQSAPTPTAAFFVLAVMFPTYFMLINALSSGLGIGRQLVIGVLITLVVFGALPLAACLLRRVSLKRMFRLPGRPIMMFAGALLAGTSLWMFDHELVVLSQKLRGFQLDPKFLERVREYVAGIRQLPVEVVLLAMAAVPALFEEAFFRGYFYSALRRNGSEGVAIVVSAAAFGLFHAIVPNPLASERLLSSTVTGLVLGWIRWRTGSVLPGMLLHCLHNGLLMLLTYYEPQLTARQIGVSDTQHLPTLWLAVAAPVLAVGLATIGWFGRKEPTNDNATA